MEVYLVENGPDQYLYIFLFSGEISGEIAMSLDQQLPLNSRLRFLLMANFIQRRMLSPTVNSPKVGRTTCGSGAGVRVEYIFLLSRHPSATQMDRHGWTRLIAT